LRLRPLCLASLALFAAVLSCTRKGETGLRVRYQGAKATTLGYRARRAGPALSAMGCYFVALKSDTDSTLAPGLPAHLGYLRVSPLRTYSEITTTGAPVRLKLFEKLRFEIVGVGTGGSCAGMTTVAELYAAATEPTIYVVGTAELSLTEAVDVTVPNTYEPEGPPNGPADALSLLPVTGLHRGGLTVTITGTNFVSGATVSFGGTPSPDVTFVSATQLLAKTPSQDPQLADVTVTNPSASSDTLDDAFTAFQLLFLGASESTVEELNVYRQNPVTGALGKIDGELSPAGNYWGIAVHPSGEWIVTSHSSNSRLLIWRVNLETGTISLAQNIDISISPTPTNVAFNAAGTYLYYNYSGSAGLSCSFDDTTGACTVGGGQGWLGVPSELRFSAGGDFLYTRLTDSTKVAGMPVDPMTGALGAVFDATSAITNLDFILVAPGSAKANLHMSNLAEFGVYSIDPGGTFTGIGGLGTSLGAVDDAVMAKDGSSLYLLRTASKTIRQYGVASGVATTPVTNLAFAVNSPKLIAVDGSLRYLYSAQDNVIQTVRVFELGAGGDLPVLEADIESLSWGTGVNPTVLRFMAVD
jgi:hypothetical protein